MFGPIEGLENENDLCLDILPEFIISLEASDTFLKKRIMNLPESHQASLPEEVFIKKLEDFRMVNTDDATILNFFDEHEIHALSVNAEESGDVIFGHIVGHVGNARNYGPSKDEIRKKQAEMEVLKVCIVCGGYLCVEKGA